MYSKTVGMARQLPQNPYEKGITGDRGSHCMQEEPLLSARRWHFSRSEIEHHSPSRKDGIDFQKESHLRKSYCSFLLELGMKLKVPQLTIASAMMVCHRFYMRQSHAKNDWQTIATAGIFLACKIEETPRFLNDVVVVAYEMIYKWDPSAKKKIRRKELFDKQKELVLTGERLLLSTLAFDLDMQLPYKPLVTALKRLGMVAELGKVAWNFVNDWLCTTLCLEYKPHYIAAGSVFLASKFQKVKLPLEKGKVWWMEFDVSPKQLEEAIQKMLKLFEKERHQGQSPSKEKIHYPKSLDGRVRADSSQSCLSTVSVSDLVDKQGQSPLNENTRYSKSLDGQARVDSSQSCLSTVSVSDHVDNQDVVEEAGDCIKSLISNYHHNQETANHCTSAVEVLPCRTSDTGSSSSAVDNGDSEIFQSTDKNDPDLSKRSTTAVSVSVSNSNKKIDFNQIRETIKRRRLCRATNMKDVQPVSPDVDSEAWIEKELEHGIELQYESSLKKQRKAS